MFKLAVVVVLLCSQAYARPNIEFDPHIIGGSDASEGQFPFIVSLRATHSGDVFCGGSLISPKHVLTAAHCVNRVKFMRIGAGSINTNKQKLHDVIRITVHPKYDDTNNVNDIAVLKLKTAIKFDANVQTINFNVTENMDKKNVTALGWGLTKEEGILLSSILQYLNKPIVSNTYCAKSLNTKIEDSQICLGSEKNAGMCFGDSGSPLLYKGPDGKNYVAGIVSWGIPCAKGYPDVFTRVSFFTKWIKENMT